MEFIPVYNSQLLFLRSLIESHFSVCCFFCPGGVAAFVTTPLDVAKTWIMLAKVRRWDCCLISLSPDASQMESKVNKQAALMQTNPTEERERERVSRGRKTSSRDTQLDAIAGSARDATDVQLCPVKTQSRLSCVCACQMSEDICIFKSHFHLSMDETALQSSRLQAVQPFLAFAPLIGEHIVNMAR